MIDMKGKLVFGYGGVVDSTPCIYKDNGWYEGTIQEYDIRKAEEVELFEELTWRDKVKTENNPYGYRSGGGMSQLCKITEDEIQRLRVLNQERKIQKEKAEKIESEGIRLSWANRILQEVAIRGSNGIEILSEAVEKNWSIQYNNIANEGGEGYVPHRATQEDGINAKQILGLI